MVRGRRGAYGGGQFSHPLLRVKLQPLSFLPRSFSWAPPSIFQTPTFLCLTFKTRCLKKKLDIIQLYPSPTTFSVDGDSLNRANVVPLSA